MLYTSSEWTIVMDAESAGKWRRQAEYRERGSVFQAPAPRVDSEDESTRISTST